MSNLDEFAISERGGIILKQKFALNMFVLFQVLKGFI